jgi:hypothetical protein
MDILHYLSKCKSSLPKDDLHQVWSKLSQWFWGSRNCQMSWEIYIIYCFIYCFTFRLRIFHLYGDVTIAGEELQMFGLFSARRAFEQGGIFIVPHLL